MSIRRLKPSRERTVSYLYLYSQCLAECLALSKCSRIFNWTECHYCLLNIPMAPHQSEKSIRSSHLGPQGPNPCTSPPPRRLQPHQVGTLLWTDPLSPVFMSPPYLPSIGMFASTPTGGTSLSSPLLNFHLLPVSTLSWSSCWTISSQARESLEDKNWP